MARLIALLCNDDSLTPLAVRGLRESVDFPSTQEASGFGYGWIQDGRSLLRTTPKPGSGTPDFMDLMADIPARAIVGHIREPDGGSSPTLDLQPFRFRKWVFAHVGEQPELEQTRGRLLESVPDFIQGNIKGSTSSEVFGHRFLSELYSSGLLDKGRTSPERCAEGLAETIRAVQIEAAVAEFAAVAVTERSMVAGSIGRQLYYREVRGLQDSREQPLFAGHKPKQTSYPSFKGVWVTDSPTDASDWEALPDGHVLSVGSGWDIQIARVS